ncbi:hypothetical protein FOCC_FOCC015173 [Frankliniella occidentalis]|nr:hypothetical protein FOCC_FOCC015173 [Frankliniella occidentalis]
MENRVSCHWCAKPGCIICATVNLQCMTEHQLAVEIGHLRLGRGSTDTSTGLSLTSELLPFLNFIPNLLETCRRRKTRRDFSKWKNTRKPTAERAEKQKRGTSIGKAQPVDPYEQRTRMQSKRKEKTNRRPHYFSYWTDGPGSPYCQVTLAFFFHSSAAP